MALSNTQYDEIVREYDRKQSADRYAEQERRREVYAKDDRLTEIDETLASLAVRQTEKLLSGDESALVEMRSEADALRNEKREIIRSLGYDEDFFAPPYSCPDCKDTGYVNGKRCHCFKQAAIDLVYAQSNLSRVLERENFSHFSLDYYSKETVPGQSVSPYEQAVLAEELCHGFVNTFDTEFRNLIFCGMTGVGKTFLSNCVAKALLDKGHSVVYFTAPQLFDILEKDVFGHDDGAKAMRQSIYDVELLIIDDLGTEVPNSFTSSQLFLVLNERILREKSTIISTNLQLSEIRGYYSERTFSRISSNYTVIRLFGEDIRLKLAFQN